MGELLMRIDLRSEQGFGLIEMLISVVLMSLLVAGAYKSLVTAQETSVARGFRNATRQGARIAAQRMVTELRMAGYRAEGAPILAASGELLTFAGDIDEGSDEAPCVDESAAPDGGLERITYRVGDTIVTRSVECWNGKAWSSEGQPAPLVPINPTAGSVFRYFDETGIELHPGGAGLSALQREDVARIDIMLNVFDTDSVARVADLGFLNEYFLRMAVKVRNKRGGVDVGGGGDIDDGGGDGDDGDDGNEDDGDDGDGDDGVVDRCRQWWWQFWLPAC